MDVTSGFENTSKLARPEGLEEDEISSSSSDTHHTSDCEAGERNIVVAEEDITSSSGSSSSDESVSEGSDEETSEDEDSGTDTVHLGAPNQDDPMLVRSNLSDRLSSFLPAIRRANARLDHEIAEGLGPSHNLEVDDEEDEDHVNMELGLGVLEKVDPDNTTGSEEEDEISGSEIDSGKGVERHAKRKVSVLDSLMGRPKRPKPEIQEVDAEDP